MPLTRSRVAMLCFGGWGMEVMLHLWPRLRFVQEEREALGLEQELPDLSNLAAFAAVIPEPLKTENYEPFKVYGLRPGLYPDPFYVERTWARLGEPPPDSRPPTLTHSEWKTQRLLQALDPLGGHPEVLRILMDAEATSLAGDRATRREMFQAGIRQSERVARTIVREVVDKTRLDFVQTREPLVHTSIYVVASLCEPLASALVWPLLSELVAVLGDRNVMNVVGIFATGSFAEDDTMPVEEAAVHSALSDWEVLMGMPPQGDHQSEGRSETEKALRNLVRTTKNGFEGRVGVPLMNRLYLVDREKSTQSLARDPNELVVLVGNAMEAFLIADGEGLVEQRLQPDWAVCRNAPYSLLGAASDYIPLPDYVYAAVRGETKRIVRETVLGDYGQGSPESVTHEPQTSLGDLEANPEAVVRLLTREVAQSRMFGQAQPDSLFTRLRRRLQWAPWLRPHAATREASQPLQFPFSTLRIARTYLLRDIQEALHQANHLSEWVHILSEHARSLVEGMPARLELGRFEQVWGLHFLDAQLSSRLGEVETALSHYRSETWAERHSEDARVVPHALYLALQKAVDDICEKPIGLLNARERLNGWIDQMEKEAQTQHAGESTEESAQWHDRYGADFRRWSRDFVRVAGARPNDSAVWVRVVMLVLFVGYLAAAWMLYAAPGELGLRERALSALAVVLGGIALGSLPQLLQRLSEGTIRERRIDLALRTLSHTATSQVQSSLHRVYELLGEQLEELRTVVLECHQNLVDYSRLEDPPSIPPMGIRPTHLRASRKGGPIWERIRDLVKKEVAAEGTTSEQYFMNSWSKSGQGRIRHWFHYGEHLAQCVRLALELPFNREEAVHLVIPLEAQRRMISSPRPPRSRASQATLLNRLQRTVELAWSRKGTFCGFSGEIPRPDDRGESQTVRVCSACRPHSGSCGLLGPDWRQQTESWSLASLVRARAESATQHLLPAMRVIPDRKDFIERILKQYGIEQLLFHPPPDEPTGLPSEPGAPPPQDLGQRNILQSGTAVRRPQEDLLKDFIDDLCARAKPCANFERLTSLSPPLEIEFCVTADACNSKLRVGLAQRGMTILSSGDPMSILLVRTVHALIRVELLLSERCAMHYHRLPDESRKKLVLLSETQHSEALYGKPDPDVVSYDHVQW